MPMETLNLAMVAGITGNIRHIPVDFGTRMLFRDTIVHPEWGSLEAELHDVELEIQRDISLVEPTIAIRHQG